MNLEQLRERLVELSSEATEIRARMEAEKRDLTAEESDRVDLLTAAFDRTKADIDRLEKIQAQADVLSKGAGPKAKPNQPGTAAVPPDDGDEDDEPAPAKPPRRNPYTVAATLQPKNGGFRNLGEMALAVRRAALSAREGGFVIDPRLEKLASASTYGVESSGADGGFAVPPDFRNAIMETVLGEDSLLSRCDQVTVSGNSFTCPMDETTPWQTTGGIQAYWDGEAVAATQSKPALGERTVKLNKIRALVPMTEELMEDASAMDAYLRRKAPQKIAFKVTLALLQGTGVGQPLGLLNAPALVTVSKESSQTADTFIALNAIKMYSRLYAPCRPNAVWVVNQDLEPQIYKLALPGTDNVGNAVTGWGTAVYLPPGGLSQSPYGTLMGRPVVFSQACETLGDLGDVFLADFTQYLALLKGGANPRVETSMHLWFDQDLLAFKFILRVGGVPWWSAAISARDGSATYSPYVTLEAR